MKILVVHHRGGYGCSQAVFYYTIKASASTDFEIVMPTIGLPDFKSCIDDEGLPRGDVIFVKALSVDTKDVNIV